MAQASADVVICGAGIAGISTAYHLTVTQGIRNVVLVDERPPLSLTSDKSTECYRNWWPGPGNAMVSLMNRSIDIMDVLARDTGNLFQLNRRGYLFATADPDRIPTFRAAAQEAASLGAGPVRYHTGHPDEPAYLPTFEFDSDVQVGGADLITDTRLIGKYFPDLSEETVAVVHPRRCGWFSAQQLGMYLLEEARAHGATLIRSRVEDVEVRAGRVERIQLAGGDGPASIRTSRFVIAAGPFLKQVASMVGLELPVFCELHTKVSFNDHLGVVPREAPLLIWTDPQHLPWSEDEKRALSEGEETRWLLEQFPEGIHARPEGTGGSKTVLLLWTYDTTPIEPVVPPVLDDPFYPEITIRGLAAMLPSMRAYFDRLPQPQVDGGYYIKTQENRPLIGPLPVGGTYVISALSGFGMMASPAGGELIASYIAGGELPAYAPWFLLERYQDPEYLKLLENWEGSGQL